MNMSGGAGLLAIFTAFGLGFIVAADYLAERRRLRKTMWAVRNLASPFDTRRRELATPLRSRVFSPALRRLGHTARRITRLSAVERLSRVLAYAGDPIGWDAERVLAFKLLSGLVLGSASLAFGLLTGVGALRLPVLALVIGVGGYYLPDWALGSRAKKRQEEILRALPDCLDLLSIIVEAGMGFDAAVARVARQIGGPLGQELNRLVREMQLGKARADALRDLSERTNLMELRAFMLSMIQADIFGIAISRVLEVEAEEMRVKHRQRAEEIAQRVPVKIIFPLLFCIFPALFVVLVGPAIIRIFETLIGL